MEAGHCGGVVAGDNPGPYRGPANSDTTEWRAPQLGSLAYRFSHSIAVCAGPPTVGGGCCCCGRIGAAGHKTSERHGPLSHRSAMSAAVAELVMSSSKARRTASREARALLDAWL